MGDTIYKDGKFETPITIIEQEDDLLREKKMLEDQIADANARLKIVNDKLALKLVVPIPI